MLGGTFENGQQIGRGKRAGKGLGRNASVFLVCIFTKEMLEGSETKGLEPKHQVMPPFTPI
jgi:hypothetical protein